MRVETKNLTMQYHDADRIVEVFSDLNLSIDSGTSLAIVGASGVGKTTLLMLLGALEKPVGGSIDLGGRCITNGEDLGGELAAFRGENIGFVFQFHYLLPEFDAVENVAMPLIIRGKSQKESFNRAEELLKMVGLEDRFSHRPGQLSGGEQQRVAIARALAPEPGVLLADEPTGNLDRQTARDVTELLLKVHREAGNTLIVATHSLELAGKMNRIVELTPTGIVEK